MMPPNTSRRTYLKALAAASTLTLSGCASVLKSADAGDDASSSLESPPVSGEKQSSGGSGNSTKRNVSGPSSDADGTTENQTETSWSTEDLEIKDPAVKFTPVDLPDDDTQYPQMGSADDVATLYGSWKCPYTREFVVSQLPSLIDEYVRPGDISIRYRAVAYQDSEPFLGPDAPATANAGLAVWENDPESFWNYFTYVFANQPQERYEWGQPALLERFAQKAGVDSPEQIAAAAREAEYTLSVQQTASSASKYDIWTVPRLRYDGEVTAPTVNPAQTREQLE